MNLHEIIKQNMLRFGTKNLNEANIRLIEETEPDLMQYDWSKGGTVTWEKANINSIINYITARDSTKDYAKYAIYTPVMQWFAKNDGDATRESLMIWCGKDPYYGLGNVGETAKQNATTFGRPTKEIQQDLIAIANRWQTEVVDQLKGTSDLDGKFKSYFNMIPLALKKTADAGIWVEPEYITTLTSNLNKFIATKNKPATSAKTYPFLPNGGYTANDVKLAQGAVSSIQRNLSSGDNSKISSAGTMANIQADDAARARMLSDIQNKCYEKLKDPAFQDGIRAGKVVKLDISTIVKKADYIVFESGDASVAGKAAGISNKQVVSAPEIIKFQYPSVELPDNEYQGLQENFFGDDGVTLTLESKEGIQNIALTILGYIKELEKKFPNDSIQVQSANIFAYAATSTVNSAYGTGPAFKTAKLFNKENNVKLAKERCNSMTDYTNAMLDNYLGPIFKENNTQVIKNPNQINPNIGPLWESVGGSAFGKSFTIKDYGPLFQAAYAKDPTTTPKKFYADRKYDEAKKAEYETTYSPFRVSNISIALQIIVPQSVKDQLVDGDFVVAVAGEFTGKIEWRFWSLPKINLKLKGGKMPKLFKNMPKQTMPVFNGRTTKCFF